MPYIYKPLESTKLRNYCLVKNLVIDFDKKSKRYISNICYHCIGSSDSKSVYSWIRLCSFTFDDA